MERSFPHVPFWQGILAEVISNIVISYPDNWHYYLILKVSSWRGMPGHTLGHKSDRTSLNWEMQLHFVKLFWLTSSWNQTQDNGPCISSRLFMMHLFLFSPQDIVFELFFIFVSLLSFKERLLKKRFMSITPHFAGTALLQFSYSHTQGTPVTPATWKKLASTCI